MDKKRISVTDITVGQPLPWDVYDQNNRLLLRKGLIIERDSQVQSLVDRGIFADTAALSKKNLQPMPVLREIPSVVRLLNDANTQLAILLNTSSHQDFTKSVMEIVGTVANAVKINPNIALGCILLNQVGSYAVRHCVDSAIVCMLLAESMKKSQQEISAIMAAALTMNMSMVRYQEQFQKKDTALSDIERDIIKRHPADAVDLLRALGVVDDIWLTAVHLHHENENGSGYPLGKKGDEIPVHVKILALADRYCARVCVRGYRKSLSPTAAMRDMLISDRDELDPALVAGFIRELGTYPTGSFVRLESGEIAVVTGRGNSSTTPVVHAVVGPRGVPHSFPIQRDTTQKMFSVREVLAREQADIKVSLQQIWGTAAAV